MIPSSSSRLWLLLSQLAASHLERCLGRLGRLRPAPFISNYDAWADSRIVLRKGYYSYNLAFRWNGYVAFYLFLQSSVSRTFWASEHFRSSKPFYDSISETLASCLTRNGLTLIFFVGQLGIVIYRVITLTINIDSSEYWGKGFCWTWIAIYNSPFSTRVWNFFFWSNSPFLHYSMLGEGEQT